MKIMLDTNVFISIFLFKTQRMERLKLCLGVYHRLVVPTYILSEIKDVVKRKFPQKIDEIDELFQNFPCDVICTPKNIDKTKYPNIRDSDDLPILVSAILSDIDILITGDKDFQTVQIKKPEILTLTQFLEKYC